MKNWKKVKYTVGGKIGEYEVYKFLVNNKYFDFEAKYNSNDNILYVKYDIVDISFDKKHKITSISLEHALHKCDKIIYSYLFKMEIQLDRHYEKTVNSIDKILNSIPKLPDNHAWSKK